MLVDGDIVLKLTNTFPEFISSWVHLVLLLVCPVASDWCVKMCTLDNGKKMHLFVISWIYPYCWLVLVLATLMTDSSAINYPARATRPRWTSCQIY